MNGFEAAWGRVERRLTNRPLAGVEPGSFDLVAGIVGGEEPSKYSRSPELWNRLFSLLGVRGVFLPLDLPAAADFDGFAADFLSLPGCLDLTVTNPYKATAYRFARGRNESGPGPGFAIPARVEAFACLNHIVPKPGGTGWICDNTDGAGLVRALGRRIDLAGSRVLLVGAGGAAASIAYELLAAGAVLSIANIVAGDARSLADRLSGRDLPGAVEEAGGWGLVGEEAPRSGCIVSAITRGTPLDAAKIRGLDDGVLLADVRYGASAEFAAAARAAGRACIDGREMLFGQFALAASLVFGISDGRLEGALDAIREDFLSS